MLKGLIILTLVVIAIHDISGLSVRPSEINLLDDDTTLDYDLIRDYYYGDKGEVSAVKSEDDINPDAQLDTLELLRKYGYPAESHEVITQDGYVLTLHRIPHGRNNGNSTRNDRPVVLLHHGLLCSSSDWLMNTVDKGLGYRLADAGYDVWMANARGNTYSRQHTSLTPDESAFWEFSFHEIGVYDVISEIDYILSTTGRSHINYIGHSMGTVVFWIAMSEHPEYNSKIKSMMALGPVAFLNGTVSPIRYFMEISSELQIAERIFGDKEFLPNQGILRQIKTFICNEKTLERAICENVMFLLCGYDRPQLNESMIPVITAHNPAGTSTHTIIHFLQLMKSGKFRQFDFGKRRNLKMYGSVQPPDYDLAKVTAKVALFYGPNDWLADPSDVLELAAKLPNNALTYRVKSVTFNHLDFLYAIDINKLLYNDLLQYLKKL